MMPWSPWPMMACLSWASSKDTTAQPMELCFMTFTISPTWSNAFRMDQNGIGDRFGRSMLFPKDDSQLDMIQLIQHGVAGTSSLPTLKRIHRFCEDITITLKALIILKQLPDDTRRAFATNKMQRQPSTRFWMITPLNLESMVLYYKTYLNTYSPLELVPVAKLALCPGNSIDPARLGSKSIK